MHTPAEQKISGTFEAALDELYPMLHMVKNQASKLSFDEVTLSRIELACEEALVNIIEYAYTDGGAIEIEVETTQDKVSITLIDSGVAFDPLAHSKKFLVKSMESNQTIGGYGTFFMMRMMDEVHYIRDGDRNVLTMSKKAS